ncbi:kelch repeat protein TeaB [Myxozyma melibiosi]|uniref:Kelch repeat protein TeaB n=1 Tax=Myxozyma melibiosi TaxID=54550 RepID=A0ABR1F9N0_9ASCO
MAEPVSPVFQFAAISGPPPDAEPILTPAEQRSSAAPKPPQILDVRPSPLFPLSLANASVELCPDDGKIFVFGGFDVMDTQELFNEVIIIDVETLESSHVTEPAGEVPSRRHGHTATYWKDGKLIVFGGEDESGRLLNDLYVYDLRSSSWTQPVTYGNPPYQRSRHAACLSECRTRLYFSGGSRHGSVLGDIFCLDLTTMTWSDSRSFVPRYDHTATVFCGKLWIFGGLTQDMDRPSDIVWFDLNSAAIASLVFPATEVSADSSPAMAGPHIRRSTPNPEKRVGTHFYAFLGSVVVDFTTAGPAAITNTGTSISCFDMAEMRWRTLADSSIDLLAGANWSYVAFSGTTAYLLGCKNGTDNSNMIQHILPIDLKYFGVSSKPSIRSFENVLVINDSKGNLALPPNSLNADMAALLADQQSADFKITAIQDKAITSNGDNTLSDSILVHSVILASRWPHFKRLLNSRMSEYHLKRMHIPERFSNVYALIYYLYTDTLPPETSINTVAGVLVLSNLYSLPRLRDLCFGRIQDNFTIDSAAFIWECARTAREDVLRTSAARFCMRHWGRVVRSPSFKELSKQFMIELCEEIDLESQVVTPRWKGAANERNGFVFKGRESISRSSSQPNIYDGAFDEDDEEEDTVMA